MDKSFIILFKEFKSASVARRIGLRCGWSIPPT